jgi:acyl-CoA dehydrogenase
MAILTTLCLLYLGFLFIKEASASVLGVFFLLWMLIGFVGHYQHSGVMFLLGGLGATLLLFSYTPFRKKTLTRFLMLFMSKNLPKMSSTEKEALEAGTIGFEGELFSGQPDWTQFLTTSLHTLSKEEIAFIDGPLNELCRMIDDWDITHHRLDMPNAMWDFIKDNGFLGMIIPKTYGGLEFSATAQKTILTKLYGRSITVATTVAVPNSLGPGELLLKYGTPEQKSYYLPRLAKGMDIPCFALTGPNAGSDAAAMTDTGIVCYQEWEGKKTLGISLSWDKRYITLCPVATILGLAFRLFDPDNLLERGYDIGITCALIPTNIKGVIKGRRHFPLNTAFMNGPTQGKDVFIPMDYLIGGEAMAGHGWRMLMECLSAGRAISLPSSAVGGAEVAVCVTTAYAAIRKQFNQYIGYFEGIEAPLARIIGYTYFCGAGLSLATTAIDNGEKPSVVGAILKYHTTELARQLAMDAMDIHGGKGICLGPKNYLGRGFQALPIAITVEGANILTRNLIIFGQGAIRCHPYVYKEMLAVKANDLDAFDAAFFGHAKFFLSNMVRTFVYAITKGKWSVPRHLTGYAYLEEANRFSVALAFLSDYAMAILGGKLKKKEHLSARLGDILSNLYFLSATVLRYQESGAKQEDKVIFDWSCQYLLSQCDEAIEGLINNFPKLFHRLLLKILLQPFGKRNNKPKDILSRKLVRACLQPTPLREQLIADVFKEPIDNCQVGKMNETFLALIQVLPIEKKILSLKKSKQLSSLSMLDLIDEAESKQLITQVESEAMRSVELMRQAMISVDDFSSDELMPKYTKTTTKKNKKEVTETV